MSPGLGERLCEACGSTTTLSVLSPTLPPRIDMESFDMIPFSESFSGLIDEDDDRDDSENANMMLNDMSYTVERYPDVKDLDPEWDDEDIAEVMVLSPKLRNSKLPTISEELDASSPRSNQADCGESLPQLDSPFLGSDETHCCETLPKEPPPVTLSDFDLVVPPSGHPMLCKKRSSGKLYVVKTLDDWNASDEQAVVEAIRNLRAPFLEDFLWNFPGVAKGEEGRMYIVSASHSGNLLDLMKTGPIAPMDALFYLCEIVDGVESLHTAGIIHRDLAPSNVLLDHAGHIVLSNFSNAIVGPAGSNAAPPSARLEYQAPEILLGWAHDFAVDCWSLGILLHVLLAGTNPIVSSADENLTFRSRILKGDVVASEMLPWVAKDLITKCLERNPKLRTTIEQVRDHEYFATVDWYGVRQKKISPPPRHPSPAPSPKLRPTSQDFPLPPASRLSYLGDTSLDLPFTLQTASKAVPFQPRLERIPSREFLRRPMGRSCSMDDLRGRNHSRRLSLNIPRSSVLRDRMRDVGPTTGAASPPLCPPLPQRLSLQIQSPDSFPMIFRSSVLERSVPEEEEPTHPSPAFTSPTMCNASPRQRMAQFWETLDAEVDRDSSGSSVPSLEIRDALRLALPNPPLPGPTARSRKLRKRVSSLALPQSHSESRFSMVSSTSVGGGRQLRKLRRPLSTTFISKGSEPIPDLPSGLEQIGKGIGFTYKMPVASHSKASICTPSERSFAGRLFRSGLGLLRKVKSQPKLSSAAGSGSRSRGPPAMIQTSQGLSSVAPAQGSPTSDGPLTPDSLSFPPLPEIQVCADPFAKDATADEPQVGGPDATLRLVAVSPGNALDFSSWNMD